MSLAGATSRLPVFVLVDDDAETLAALTDAIDRRYGREYAVHAETSAAAALSRLETLGAAGAEVAVIIADQWMPEMDGVELLSLGRDLHPGARRVLLVGATDQSALPPILQATALGRIDLHIHKPWQPADDLLHPPITDLLAEWTRANRPPFERVRIIAERRDPRGHELRDLLERNSVGFGSYDAGSPDGTVLLHQLGLAEDRLPVVTVLDGPTLVQPTNVEVAEALGVKTAAGPGSYDVAIIGAGPAGLAAAVYAASEGLRTVVVEREAMGGQAATSSMIRNYLGFPRGISGAELARRAYSQAWHFGTEFIFAQDATRLRSDAGHHVITLSGGTEMRARTVVLATGVSYRRLGVPDVDRLLGAGVFYGAATSEASAMAGHHVFVVGAGNSAGQAAVHLAKFADRVTLLVRGASLTQSMSAYLIAEIERTPNIDVRVRTHVVGARGEQRLEGLVLEDRGAGAREGVSTEAVFILIGASPRTAWLPESVRRDQHGFLLTGAEAYTVDAEASNRARHPLETSLPGVFAVGDVRHRSVKRVAAAVGEGAAVVSSVHAYLAL